MIDPSGEVADAISLDDVRGRGARRDAARCWPTRTAAIGPDDPYTFIYTSGTTGPPKGCVLTHGNYRSVLDMVAERGLFDTRRRPRLPVPAARPRVRAADPCSASTDRGTAIAYYGGDTKEIIAELMEVKPTYLPSVPRIFEKIYTLGPAAAGARRARR